MIADVDARTISIHMLRAFHVNSAADQPEIDAERSRSHSSGRPASGHQQYNRPGNREPNEKKARGINSICRFPGALKESRLTVCGIDTGGMAARSGIALGTPRG